MNALKKRKDAVGKSALHLINSWKQLVSDANKPKPKIVVEPCHGPTEDDDDDDDNDDGDDDEEPAVTISNSRLGGYM